MRKIIRITTVPRSLTVLLKGQLSFMQKNGFNVVCVSSSGSALEQVKKNEHVRVIALDMTRQLTPLKDIYALIKMCIVLRREKPQIVHTHTPKAGIVGMLASFICMVPYRLHTVAGMPLLVHHGMKRKILNIVEWVTYKCATKVYPNSHNMAELIIQLGLAKREKVRVIGYGSSNGIDTSFFRADLFSTEKKDQLRASLKIDKEDFVFIFVGRLVKDKGINELVHAFTRLNLLHGKAKLVLVGSYEENLDPLLSETKNNIKQNPNIIEAGWQNDVRPWFAISDALVFPSYREGFPNVVMQAGAMGLPSIVTDINGCNEIIINEQNGMIIPPKDEEKLYLSMKYFLEHLERVNQMANNARELITARYEQKKIWEALLHEYQMLCDEIN